MKAAAISTVVDWGSCSQRPNRLDDEATLSPALHGRPTEIVVEVGTLVVRLGVGVGVGRVVAVANAETEGRGVDVVRRGALEVVRVGSGVGVAVERAVAVGVGDEDEVGEGEGLVVRTMVGEARAGVLVELPVGLAVEAIVVWVAEGSGERKEPVGLTEADDGSSATLGDSMAGEGVMDCRRPGWELDDASPMGRGEGFGS